MVNEEDKPEAEDHEQEDRATALSVSFVMSPMLCLSVQNGWTNPRTRDSYSVSAGATGFVPTASLPMLVTGTTIVLALIMPYSVHVGPTTM